MTYSLPPVDIDMFVPVRTTPRTPLFMAVTKMIVKEWGRLTSNKSRSLLSPVAETPLSNPDSLPLSATPEKSSTASCASHNETNVLSDYISKAQNVGQCNVSRLYTYLFKRWPQKREPHSRRRHPDLVVQRSAPE